jgi:hypothetical protein
MACDTVILALSTPLALAGAHLDRLLFETELPLSYVMSEPGLMIGLRSGRLEEWPAWAINGCSRRFCGSPFHDSSTV